MRDLDTILKKSLVISNGEYHEHEAIGSTTAKHFLTSPMAFYDYASGAVKTKEKGVFKEGTIMHMKVLEPEKFAECVTAEGPINPRTGEMYGRDTQKFRKWEEDNPDKIVVDKWMLTAMQRMPDEVHEILAADGVAEHSFFHGLEHCSVKCRPDWLTKTCIYDLKTIDSLDNVWRQLKYMNYWFSAGWYRNVIESETGILLPFKWIFVEKSSPQRWIVADIGEENNTIAYETAKQVMSDINFAFLTDDWTDKANIYQTFDIRL